MSARFTPILGILFFLAVCVIASIDRKRISFRLTAWGIALQVTCALLITKTYPDVFFAAAQNFFQALSSFAAHGAKFLFGSLAQNNDFVILSMGSVIVFVSSLMALLNYFRILPAIIYVFASIMQRTMRTSGAETLAAAMFVFMGIEAVTGLKNVIGRMTRSELFTVMTCFMATIAGSVMAVYVGIFGANAGYILAASIMNAPAALAVSKIIVPETGSPETRDHVEWKLLLPAEHGVVEAAANGALDGMKLAVSIAAILMAFVSLIYMVDCGLGIFGLSFEIIGGYVFAAPAFLMGVPWEDCLKAGNLLALKTVFNEWLAYSRMKELSDAGLISSRTVMIMTYALCSFSNFGSMAILIGGISSLAPERKSEVIQLGMRALLAGLAAGFLTACVAGLLSWD